MSLPPKPTESAEPIKAWRVWTPRGEGTALHSMTYSATSWTPCGVTVAECQRGVHCGGAPHPHCYCGLYAVKKFSDAVQMTSQRVYIPHVLGRVNLWGVVLEHEKGYRAQYGSIDKLYVEANLPLPESDRLRQSLRRTFGVDVDFYSVGRYSYGPVHHNCKNEWRS